jgi:hypothetical protein
MLLGELAALWVLAQRTSGQDFLERIATEGIALAGDEAWNDAVTSFQQWLEES